MRNRMVALGVLGLAGFLDGLDANIVTVALPSIQRDLGVGFATAQWTLTGYALTFAMFLITGGRLGDVFGAKRMFLTGVALFTVASVVAGLAGSPAQLVAGRVAQGLMAALMLPQVMAFVVRMFDRRELPLAAAVVGGMLSVGSVGGPLLGGLLTDLDLLGLGWRAVFFVNLPIGVLALVLGARLLPALRGESAPRLDLTGMLLLSAAALALLYPLMQGREQGWPVWMFALLAAAGPLLAGFVAHQRLRGSSALVPLSLFRRRSFSAGLAVALFAFIGATSYTFVLTYHLQFGLGWPAGRTALAIAACPLGIVAMFQVAYRFGGGRERRFVAGGALLVALAVLGTILAVRLRGPDLDWVEVAAANLLVGVGMGLLTPILATCVLGGLPAGDAGAGSGVVNATTQLGSAIGIAGAGAILFALIGSADFGAAVSATLWFNVAAFLLTAALTPLLAGGREQLDEVAGGVGEQNLPSSGSGHDVAAERQPRAA
ncbi:MAG TPA: MFS transporter [Actinophytocola sp.]|uniref:MFS transporter n=1 Tax=Actinophytocola sp. TaxID=1872138 RepID=UPI002DB97336|nr:MFS transporter [Actinophytocola sp.]HEU5471992.1 MFS transporter [Actinophytocola sp.]